MRALATVVLVGSARDVLSATATPALDGPIVTKGNFTLGGCKAVAALQAGTGSNLMKLLRHSRHLFFACFLVGVEIGGAWDRGCFG